MNAFIQLCNNCVIHANIIPKHINEPFHHLERSGFLKSFSLEDLGSEWSCATMLACRWLLGVRKCSLEKVSSCCTIMQSLHMRSNRVEGQRADFTEEARGFIKIKLLEKEKVPVHEPSENDSAAIFGIWDILAQRLTSFCNLPLRLQDLLSRC